MASRDSGMSLARVAAAVLAAALLAGCEPSVEDYLPEPNVYCVVRAGSDSLRLLAGMSIAYKDSVPQSGRWNGVAGVDARVRGRAGETVLLPKPDSTGYYFAAGFGVQAGETLHMEARYPGGEVVRGSTAVPAEFRIERVAVDTVLEVPWPGDTWPMLRLRFEWTESRNATSYSDRVTGYYSGNGRFLGQAAGVNTAIAGRRDSVRIPLSTVYWDTLRLEPEEVWLDSVRLFVEALDRNLHDYWRFGWWLGGSNRELLHLDGGLGVFGSRTAAPETVVPVVTLRRAFDRRQSAN